MTDPALKAAVDPYLFERLDAILVEEDRMHPIGCSSWEEEARVAVDIAKDTITTLLAALSSQASVMEAMAKALEASTMALAHVDSSLTAMADGGHAPASGTWGFVLRRIDANRTALSQYRTLGGSK